MGVMEVGTCWSGWSGAQPDGRCLPPLIFPCTIKCRSSLLAPAHLGGPGKRAVKRLCVCMCFMEVFYMTSIPLSSLHCSCRGITTVCLSRPTVSWMQLLESWHKGCDVPPFLQESVDRSKNDEACEWFFPVEVSAFSFHLSCFDTVGWVKERASNL